MNAVMNAVKIIRIVILILAIVAALVAIPYSAVALVVLGLALGFMGIEEERRMMYLVMAIALATVTGSLGVVPLVGDGLTDILTNLSTAVSAGAVAVIMMIIKDRVME